MRKSLISMIVLLSGAAFARTEERQVPAFTAVRISSGMHATVEIGAQKPVRIDADDEALAAIVTEVVDGELRVHYKPDTHLRGDHEVRIAVQAPQIHGLSASGGSEIRGSFTRSDEANVQASGGSQIHARGLDARSLSAQASGGSILELSGAVDSVDLQLSGGSQLHGKDLSARDANVQGSGGSEAQFKASGHLRGALSGGSQLHVTGGAQTRVATSGGSEVTAD